MIAIARREIVERRMAFIAAAVASLLPLIGRWAPLPIAGNRGLVTFILVATLAISFAAGLGIVLGASMIGRDLAERRLSFYLARPVSTAAIWFGKLAGNFLTAFLSALIVLIPTAVIVPEAWRGNWTLSTGPTVAWLALGVLILLLISHIVSTMVRSRSPWLVADLAAAVLVVVCCGLVVRDAWRVGAVATVILEIAAIVASALAVALAAGELQLRHGRTDVRRNHRALSMSLWSGMAIVVVTTVGWGTWVRNPAARDLRIASVATPASGPWIAILGSARWRLDYPAIRLLNTRNQAALSLRDAPTWRSGFRFAREGGSVAWVDSSDPSQIGVADLGTTARAHHFEASNRSPLQDFAMSPDGSRVATMADGILAVFDVRDGRSIVAFHVDEELTNGRRTSQTPRPILSFRDDDHVMLYRAPADRRLPGSVRSLTIDECDLGHRILTRTGAFQAFGSEVRVNLTSDDRLLVTLSNDDLRGNETQRRFILDGRSGAVLRQIEGMSRRLLADGAIASLQRRNERLALVVQKGTTRVIDLGPAESAFLAPSVAAGSVTVVMKFRPPGAALRGETLLIDETTGRIGRRLVDAWPLAWYSSGWADPPQPVPAATLFYQGGRLVRFDPATGRTITLAGR